MKKNQLVGYKKIVSVKTGLDKRSAYLCNHVQSVSYCCALSQTKVFLFRNKNTFKTSKTFVSQCYFQTKLYVTFQRQIQAPFSTFIHISLNQFIHHGI